MAQSNHLRSVEADPPSPPRSPDSSGGGNGSFGERLARIETKMEFVATREDISDLKVLIAEKDSTRSKWLIGVMVTVVLAVVSASVVLTVALLRIPSAVG